MVFTIDSATNISDVYGIGGIMLLWLSQVAFGQPFVVDVGEPVEIRCSRGAWIRVFLLKVIG